MNKASIENLWNNLIHNLKNTFTNESIYINCIKPAKIYKFTEDTIYILVPSIFAKSIFVNECKELITDYFKNSVNKTFNLVFSLNDEKSINNIDENIINNSEFHHNDNSNLNSEYTLNNFVVGEFNKSAYNAVCAISKSLGSVYNPLFIYGATGLGKTHLINGLGNYYVKQYPNKKVKYIDSNDFVRDVFFAISKGGNFVEELKREYSSYDLLLIDDIQYLAGKDKTNEIFFNIFNNLVKNNKQIIITSDKNPDQLDSLEERMVSRFNSGLTIKIEYPETEVLKRIIIERLKNQENNFIFSEDAIDEIVKYYNSDLRKLIGFLNRISFYAIQYLNPHDVISKDFVHKFISDTQTKVLAVGDNFNPEVIINTICKWYGVKVELVKGKPRLRHISDVRHICMYILRNKYNMGLSDIGALFSNRDHTTVLSAINKVEKMIEKDDSLKEFIEKSINKI